MSTTAFVRLYENIFYALCGYPGLLADHVVEENIHPTDDPLEPVPGASIIYSLSASKEDLRARRFEGTITVTTGSPDSKLEAHEIMSLVRRALVPRALTRNTLRVALFQEQGDAKDAGKTREEWRVISTFKFRMVEDATLVLPPEGD